MNMLVYGITGNNNLNGVAGYSLISQHQVSGTGPDVLVESKVIPAIYTNTGTHAAPAQEVGNALTYQIDLVPEGSSTIVSSASTSSDTTSNTMNTLATQLPRKSRLMTISWLGAVAMGK